MSQPRLLLVSPGFHGYWRSIADALERRGYAVSTHVYDAQTAWGRVAHKLGSELPQRLGREPLGSTGETDRARANLESLRPDVLLVIKGDALGAEFWAAAQDVPRRGLWLYDELRRTTHTDDTLGAAGAIASYSPHDVVELARRGHGAIHVPLAHDPHLAFTERPSDEVVFVGARYPRREGLLTDLAALEIPVRAYGRDWSRHPFDRLRTWRLRTPAVAHGRDLDRGQAYGAMAGARATLNIHGDQDGFTMRTFEACGVGALQLLDRADVTPFYEPGTEVVVFASAEEAAEQAQRATRDPLWASGIREAARARTLAEHTFDHRAATLEQLWA